MTMRTRSVFYVSDGTGITAETFGNAVLNQFEFKPRHVRLGALIDCILLHGCGCSGVSRYFEVIHENF